LPLDVDPWGALATQLGADRDAVKARLRAMQDAGVIRRIAAVPNHYRVGVTANGMTVWDVDDARVDELGERVGALDCVSHCYRRPRRAGAWRYNLFAMVHGATRAEVHEKAARIAGVLGDAARAHEVLFSTRVLKKAGFRMAGG
jgi:siroheme decarboxylase